MSDQMQKALDLLRIMAADCDTDITADRRAFTFRVCNPYPAGAAIRIMTRGDGWCDYPMEFGSDEERLQFALGKDDAPFLLDLAISGLYWGHINPRIALWLAQRLERVLKGEDSRKLFGLVNPEGAPRGKHGTRHYDTDQVAALLELARRRFKLKGDAAAAVAKVCGLSVMLQYVVHSDWV